MPNVVEYSHVHFLSLNLPPLQATINTHITTNAAQHLRRYQQRGQEINRSLHQKQTGSQKRPPLEASIRHLIDVMARE